MIQNRLLLFAILLLPVIISVHAWYFWYSPVATVVLVRHAERLNASDTTSLSEVGAARAKRLVHVLGTTGINRIYVSQKLRTAQTAEPISKATGIVPAVIPANDVRRYADSVKSHRGETILIVGHSDTIPQIMANLGIANPPEISRDDFDNLFVVTVFRYRSTMTRLRF